MAASISPRALADRIAAGDAPAVVDVRSKREFDAGHVLGAVHVPFWQVRCHLDLLDAFRQRPLVVYCGHGPRARIAGASLARAGFREILYLTGHMQKWKALKLPLETS